MNENKFRSQSQNQSKSSIVSQNKIPPPSSNSNDIKFSKKRIINNSSSNSISSIGLNNRNFDFKDSLEGSISESKTNILIPDSLNNTKSSIGYGGVIKKNSRKKILKKNESKENEVKIDMINNEEKTKKIDYRFFSKFSFKFGGDNNKNKEKNQNMYWLAVYDKLIKTKKILKILSYYDIEKNKNEKTNYNNQGNIKEQLLIIKDFDIYFMKSSNRPFIKYIKGNCIFTKIYLLTFEQIIFILNYINRYKLIISPKIANLLIEKGSYQKINETFKNFPYNMIYGMGSYMNINIIGFSNYNIQNQNNLSYNYLNQNYPNSRKIAKLVKLLMINFPKYSFKFFVCYLLSKIRFENFAEKTNEIKNIVYSTNKSFMPLKPNNHKKLISNSLIHSSYSPLSNYDDEYDDINNRNININNNTDNNNYNYNNYYLQIQLRDNKESTNEILYNFHTYDNRNNKYNITKSDNKNKVKIINKQNNKNEKNKNLSERKNNYKKHTESIYLNSYLGTDKIITNLIFNKSKTKKSIKETKTSISQVINNFKSNNESITKSKKRLNKSEIRTKVFTKNNNKINYIQVKNKKKIERKENHSIKPKEKKEIKKGINIFNNTEYEKYEDKNKSKKKLKLVTNTKSEETKIGSTNKDKENINNSCKEEINKENTGIFVVSKKIYKDMQDSMDIDSSMELNDMNKNEKYNNNNNVNEQYIEYMTPEKKKKYKYYS